MIGGIMFHHFHDNNKHIEVQGSIDKDTFEKMIVYLKENFNLLSAEKWIENSIDNKLEDNDICLTFDDALKCQFDIALPILEKYNLKGIWSIYTSILEGEIELLEVFRYFRCKYFKDIDSFYQEYFKIMKTKYIYEYLEIEKNFLDLDYLKEFTFYSENDKKFRYYRNEILTEEQYKQIYFIMMENKKVDYDEYINILWMNRLDVKNIADKGHIISLHSHNHPTTMRKYKYENQLNEYRINQEKLIKIIDKEIDIVAYPCGNYNEDTLKVMNELGVTIGFCSNMDEPIEGKLFYPRLDHADLLKMMEGKKNENNYIYK